MEEKRKLFPNRESAIALQYVLKGVLTKSSFSKEEMIDELTKKTPATKMEAVRIFQYFKTKNMLRKLENRKYAFCGIAADWINDPDRCTESVLNMFQNSDIIVRRGRAHAEKTEVKIEEPNDAIMALLSDTQVTDIALVTELRRRGWQVSCQRPRTVYDKL